LAVVAMLVFIAMSWNSSRAAAQAVTVDARGRTVTPQATATVRRPVRRDKAHR
jgi:hypothetical protein